MVDFAVRNPPHEDSRSTDRLAGGEDDDAMTKACHVIICPFIFARDGDATVRLVLVLVLLWGVLEDVGDDLQLLILSHVL